jgi:hypothetical protein
MPTVLNRTRIASFILMVCSLSATWAVHAQQAGSDSSTKAAFPAPGFGVAVSIDQPEYWTDFMPPGVRAPTIGMTLTVYNNSDQSVTFQFPTSQRYDFAIRDSSGREVWRWSDGRFFLQVLGSLTLEPGDAVRFKTEHEFVDEQGEPLPEGVYTVQGALTARDGQNWVKRTMEGRVSFRHSHVF